MSLQIVTRNMQHSELDAVISLKEKCFGLSRSHLRKAGSLRNHQDFFIPEDVFVIDNSGQIDSMVELTNMCFCNGDDEISIGGIGGVVTLPEARGQGRMGTLLNYAIEQMEQRNIPLSILWGETKRYRNYGWEMAGSNMIFTLTAKSMSRVSPAAQLKMEGYRKEKHLNSIITMHRQNYLRVKRTVAQYEFLFYRPGLMIWYGSQLEENAYLVLSGSSIIEFGGSEDVLISMLAQLFQNHAFSELKLYCPETETSFIRKLYSISSIWHNEPLGMLKVINLQRLLECFAPQIKENLRGNSTLQGERVTLEMTDSKQNATVFFEDDQVKVVPGEDTPQKISLTDIEMVRFLFPFFYCPENETEAKFAPLFKLPFFWNQLDMV